MTKMFLTSLNTNLKKSLNRKERFLDDCIIVGYLNLPSIFLVLLLIYGIIYNVTIMTILGLIFAIPLIVFNIVFQFSIAPKYRLKLQNKYRIIYYKEHYDLKSSLQKLHSQTFKIKTVLSRQYTQTCLIDTYFDELPVKIENRRNLLIMFVNKKSVGNIEYGVADYLVEYKVDEKGLSIESVQENLDATRKEYVFGKFYSSFVVEAYIDRILSECSR